MFVGLCNFANSILKKNDLAVRIIFQSEIELFNRNKSIAIYDPRTITRIKWVYTGIRRLQALKTDILLQYRCN